MTFTFNDLAENANGSVLVRYGNTVVLATAVMSSRTKDDLDYFPLTVDFEERFYAAGQILGSRFIRREGRPSEDAILSGRVVDRTIRPLFEHHIRNEVQVVITVLSIDEDDPDVLAINAASVALHTSDIPWNGPASAVRIGKKKGSDTFEVNPSYVSRAHGEYELDLLACGKDGAINMIEVGASEVSEATLVEALKVASTEIEKVQTLQKKLRDEIGQEKKAIAKPEVPADIKALFEEVVAPNMETAVFSNTASKEKIYALKDAWKAALKEKLPEANGKIASDLFDEGVDLAIHRGAVEKNARADGRPFDKVRDLFAQAGGFSPILHGSGIFYRGGTHVFSALTLGGPQDSQIIDSMEEREQTKRFMHHYNFPPFAPGETGRIGGINRRAVGHGALAEKALEAVIPSKESFPYTIRVVSECLSSNGSTSMASICASTLALMDGGVPIKAPVAGIAMGLMLAPDYEKSGSYKVLTDIQGPEDEYGDMDFKVAGTRAGVTAIQLDVKVNGVPVSILAEALTQAQDARMKILDTIEAAIPAPRPDISANAPKIVALKIKPDQIGGIIGPGGKVIKAIKEKTAVDEIDIEDDGTVFITGKDGTADKAAAIILDMTREYKAGEVFEGEVTRLMDFGAFVRIGATAEGLVHVSEIAPFRIGKASDALALGEKVKVAIKEIDEKNRINLSIKAIDPEFAARKGVQPDNSPRPPQGNGRRH